jgi:hypothetical protein
MAKARLTEEEINQRVAVLRRFRKLLTEQRDRFRSYLEELDKQKDIIETGNAEQLIAHVEMEEKILTDIFSLEKVIKPLSEMYRSLSAADSDDTGYETRVQDLKSTLDSLKKEAAIRSGRNRDILSRRMMEIREEIKTLRVKPLRPGNYVLPSRPGGPSLVDIRG